MYRKYYKVISLTDTSSNIKNVDYVTEDELYKMLENHDNWKIHVIRHEEVSYKTYKDNQK